MAKQWIQGAIKRPGAFTRKAKAAGMGVQEYAGKVTKPDSTASTQTKRQANLAKTLRGFSRKRKRSPGQIQRTVRRGGDFQV